MFPIIPHHFSTNKTNFLTSSENSSARQNLVNIKIKSDKNEMVIAGCNIPADTVSEIIFSKDIVCCDSEKNRKQIVVLLNEKHQLVPEFSSIQSSELLHRLQLSNDCHSYNVHLCLTTNENHHNLILKTVKPIKAGQQLLLWFSEEVLATLQMAFLTPTNIQGQKQYVCHKCHAQFEYPNPLKLHLTLNCDHFPKFHLWSRLKTSLQMNDTHELNTCVPLNLSSNFKFELKPSLNGTQTKNDNILPATSTKEETKHVADRESSTSPENISLKRRGSCDSQPFASSTPPFSVLSTVRPSSEPTGHVTHSSAFRPYPSKLLNNFNFSSNNNSIGITTRSILNLPHLQPNLINTLTNPDINYTHAAQMETLVSSLGKSKQGHLCIYCGKVYSRKYGLKIHIRTHTGFKPLKCKYCLRPFGDPSNLNKHVRLHAEGETPYKCELCGKILVRRRDLERHLKSRHSLDLHHRSQGDETTEDQ